MQGGTYWNTKSRGGPSSPIHLLTTVRRDVLPQKLPTGKMLETKALGDPLAHGPFAGSRGTQDNGSQKLGSHCNLPRKKRVKSQAPGCRFKTCERKMEPRTRADGEEKSRDFSHPPPKKSVSLTSPYSKPEIRETTCRSSKSLEVWHRRNRELSQRRVVSENIISTALMKLNFLTRHPTPPCHPWTPKRNACHSTGARKAGWLFVTS